MTASRFGARRGPGPSLEAAGGYRELYLVRVVERVREGANGERAPRGECAVSVARRR